MKVSDVLLIGAGLIVVLLLKQNWNACSTNIVLVDANGNPAPAGVVAAPGYHQVSSTVRPSVGCLLNPFPGGL